MNLINIQFPDSQMLVVKLWSTATADLRLHTAAFDSPGIAAFEEKHGIWDCEGENMELFNFQPNLKALTLMLELILMWDVETFIVDQINIWSPIYLILFYSEKCLFDNELIGTCLVLF